MRKTILGLALFAALAAPAAADDTAPMQAAANGFYGVYKTLHVLGIPGDDDRARFAPFLSPALEALLKQAAAAEARFAKANKDSPPLIEGDVFSSLFEGATVATVGTCSGDARKGQCTAALSRADGSNAAVQWNDTVYLVNTSAGWRIDDIGYGASWDFGNKGRLSETLRQATQFQP